MAAVAFRRLWKYRARRWRNKPAPEEVMGQIYARDCEGLGPFDQAKLREYLRSDCAYDLWAASVKTRAADGSCSKPLTWLNKTCERRYTVKQLKVASATLREARLWETLEMRCAMVQDRPGVRTYHFRKTARRLVRGQLGPKGTVMVPPIVFRALSLMARRGKPSFEHTQKRRIWGLAPGMKNRVVTMPIKPLRNQAVTETAVGVDVGPSYSKEGPCSFFSGREERISILTDGLISQRTRDGGAENAPPEKPPEENRGAAEQETAPAEVPAEPSSVACSGDQAEPEKADGSDRVPELPPFPSTVVQIPTVPAAPCLDPRDSRDQHVAVLVKTFREACRVLLGRPCPELTHGLKKGSNAWLAVAAAAEQLVDHEIPPAHWVRYAFDCWAGGAKFKGRQHTPAPPLRVVFSATRIHERRGHCRVEVPGNFRPEIRCSDTYLRMARCWDTMKMAWWRLTDEQKRLLMSKYFPEGYEATAARAQAESREISAELNRAVRAWEWVWRA